MSDSLAIALDLRERGLSVIPVPRPDGRHDGKVPTIPWREFQTRRPTESEIRGWFSETERNVAVITGAVSDVVVIDADTLDAVRWCTKHLPYTPWQTETARGFHLWYRHPGVRVANRARLETRDGRLAIDVRGDGGYVIASGSVHVTGVVYQQAGDWTVDRERLPRLWLGWLQRPQQSRSTVPTPRPSGDLVDRARRYLASIPPPVIGCGSDSATLYAACRLVRGFGLDATDAEALLWAWAGGRDGWTRDWIAQKVEHALRYGTEPVGALR